MTEREFCYWLQGLFEVADPVRLSDVQTKMIKDHLALVFNKITPDYSNSFKPLSFENAPVKPDDGWTTLPGKWFHGPEAIC